MKKVEIERIQDAVEKYLTPLLSGAKWGGTRSSTSNENTTSFGDNQTEIKFKLRKDDDTSFIIKRSQMFCESTTQELNEHNIVEAFAKIYTVMGSTLLSFPEELGPAFIQRIIANSLADGKQTKENTITTIISRMDKWSRSTYEGRQHSAAIGLLGRKNTSTANARDVLDEGYCSVLSNGYDTMLICSNDGKIIDYEVMPYTQPKSSFSPFRLAHLANWSSSKRISFMLNRKGEILIFKDKMLCFARRSGKWHFLTHNPVIKQMHHPAHNILIRQSIYETCLDSSFAGTGACIGVVLKKNMKSAEKTIAERDYISKQLTEKTKLLHSIVNNKHFYDLERPLRQELAALDGALILDHMGCIIASGAILHVKGGSEEGGRLAAAKELSKLGMGIKVSQDGSIKGFHHQKNGSAEQIFSVM